MKLKVLGQSEDTARPWIVVLCDKSILKKVKQFFQQQWVKAEYQPDSPELNMPHFDILYLDRAPRLNAAFAHPDVLQDPLASRFNPETLCGMAVRVDHPCGSLNATLGGIVKVVISEGISQLYGMTVGHIVSDDMSKENEGSATQLGNTQENEDGQKDEDVVHSVFEEGNQLEADFEDDMDMNNPGLLVDVLQLAEQSSLQGHQGTQSPWPKLGHIHAASCQNEEDACNLDWALVTLEHPSSYLPNMFMDSIGPRCLWSNKTSLVDKVPLTSSRAVIVLSEARDSRQGRLLTSTSFVMLAPGRGFVQVYNMSLTDGSGKFGSYISTRRP